MRNVRSLSGLAGPNASLKDAGGGGEVGDGRSGIRCVHNDFATGTGANYTASLNLAGKGILPGDLMIAMAYTEAWYDGTYGTTEVTTAGWTQIANPVGSGGGRVYLRVADGTETTVDGNAMRNGGLSVTVIRDAAYPSAADIAASQFGAFSSTGGSYRILPALTDVTFDAVIVIATDGDRESPVFIYLTTDRVDPGGYKKFDTFVHAATLFSGPTATDGCRAQTFGENIGKFGMARIGLRTEGGGV
ncbi:hypothetical protein [Pseudophaeobacter sp.]|uniref:hypothetical protein n=1 Tax=Pseudophaeobacter sp. TaxID=1971739 RepID=UPI00329989CB